MYKYLPRSFRNTFRNAFSAKPCDAIANGERWCWMCRFRNALAEDFAENFAKGFANGTANSTTRRMLLRCLPTRR